MQGIIHAVKSAQIRLDTSLLSLLRSGSSCTSSAAGLAGCHQAYASLHTPSRPALVQASVAADATSPPPRTNKLNLCSAVNEALRIALERDER